MNKSIYCKICTKKLKGKQTFYCSIFCKNRYHQSYPQQKARGLKRKKELIEKFGGKCTICGYKKNLAALAFHHIDGSKKEFKLDARSLSNRTEARIQNELMKCTLLCHNCHAELHNPHLGLISKSLSRLL
jgi:hypothetical protein